MPWPLSENLVLSSFPSYEDVVKRCWDGACMLTVSKKEVDPRIPPMLTRHEYVHIPDGKLTDDRLALIWRARDICLEMMTQSRLTVVHCLAGRNRSALVAGLALQWTYNWTGEETLSWLRQCRPRSIHNPHFEEFLLSLGRPR